MKTNVVTGDASILLMMNNSNFDLLTDYFAFVRLSFDTPDSTKFSDETGQTGEDTG
jgi:hypothetical protein